LISIQPRLFEGVYSIRTMDGTHSRTTEDRLMSSAKLTWNTAALLAAIIASCLLLSRGSEISDSRLLLCRGTNKQMHSIGCVSCAANMLPALAVNPIEGCACGENNGGNVGNGCLLCIPGTTELGQDLVQGNSPGNPGWLAANWYDCSTNVVQQGTCQQDGSCGQLGNPKGQCPGGVQAYSEEGGL